MSVNPDAIQLETYELVLLRHMETDPGVQQGLYRFDVMTWRTPAGSVAFPPTSAPA